MRKWLPIALVAAGVGLACLLHPKAARSQNEEPFLFGDQAALTGGAIVATSRDPAAIWYNPAGLGLNQRVRLEVSASAFTYRLRPIPRGLALDLPTTRAQESIQSSYVDLVPTSIAAVRQIGDGLNLGLGVFTTEEDLSDFERTISTSDPTTSLDVAGALTGTVIRYHAGPSIGWQASPRVRIGASLFGVYESQHEFRKLFGNAAMAGPYTSAFLQRLVDSTTTRLGLELMSGVQLDPGAGWLLGFTLRSPRLIVSESAATDNSTAVISTGSNVPTVALFKVDRTPLYAEGTGFTRPPRFDGGFAKIAGDVQVSAELELVPRGVGPLDQRAVLNARSGILWQAGETTLLGFGLFTDRSTAGPPAVFPDYRVDYYGVSCGYKRINHVRLRAEERASSIAFSTTIAVRYALGVGESTRIRFDFRDAPTSGLVGRVDNETVDIFFHDVSVYLGTGFEF